LPQNNSTQAVKIIVTDKKPMGYTTVGYWAWDQPNNKGQLRVFVARMRSKRHFIAVLGHELVEVLYCWLFHVTTEQADAFDEMYEAGYKDGTIPLAREAGHDKKAPYHAGHMLGVCWEHFWIAVSFASWKAYNDECDLIMDIMSKEV
jgi:hypothetical protein